MCVGRFPEEIGSPVGDEQIAEAKLAMRLRNAASCAAEGVTLEQRVRSLSARQPRRNLSHQRGKGNSKHDHGYDSAEAKPIQMSFGWTY